MLVTKLKKDGKCELIDLPKIKEAYEKNDKNSPFIFDKWLKQLASLSTRQFMEVCVLSGCDYLASIPGVGLKTAIKLIYERKSARLAIPALKSNKTWAKKIPQDYLQEFERVMLCFVYQRVFEFPERKRLICADGSPLSKEVVDKWGEPTLNKYAGLPIPEDQCVSYSNGLIYLGGKELREKTTEELFS